MNLFFKLAISTSFAFLLTAFVNVPKTEAPAPIGGSTIPVQIEDTKDLESQPTFTGYIVAQRDSSLLVVDNKAKDYSATGGIPEFYNAIWFSTEEANSYHIGQQVNVWHGVTLESYPGQASADKLEAISPKTHPNANLTDAIVLAQVLQQHYVDNQDVLVIKSVDYHIETDTWTVTIKANGEENTFTIPDVLLKE